MRRITMALAWLSLLAVAACDGSGRGFVPLAPSPPPIAAVPAPAPGPAPFGVPFTVIAVGESVTRPETKDDPICEQWPCQFFRLVPPTSGLLEVRADFGIRQQPLDVTLRILSAGEIWAQDFLGTATVLRQRVEAGTTYQITVWYTTPGLQFDLATRFLAE